MEDKECDDILTHGNVKIMDVKCRFFSKEEEDDDNGISILENNNDEDDDIIACELDRVDVITSKPTTVIANFESPNPPHLRGAYGENMWSQGSVVSISFT